MSLPSQNDLLKMDFSKDGNPFVNVAGSPSIITRGMDWSEDGSPFYATSASNIKAMNNLSYDYMKTIDNLSLSLIKAINNLS